MPSVDTTSFREMYESMKSVDFHEPARFFIQTSRKPDIKNIDKLLDNLYDNELQKCKQQPAYHIQLPSGELYPCVCYPLMEDDTKGWQTVYRRSRRKRVKTQQQLEEEADVSNWDDVEHYGGDTYVNTNNYEHNGSLFDIGSRF